MTTRGWFFVPLQAWQLAWTMLTHNRLRLFFTIAGVATAFLLACAQIAMLVGWTNTNTALIRHAGVDLWIVAQKTLAWDYGTAIPRQYMYQARNIPGVSWTQGVVVVWNVWQRHDGQRIMVEIVGLDEDEVGGPWKMYAGRLNSIHQPQTVIIDELFLDLLQVRGLGDTTEISGIRAVVGGISRGVRTFTASPHVFTSLEQAIRYDQRYSDNELTYVLIRCQSGADIVKVQAQMRQQMKNVEVLTTDEFGKRTASYWMLETGAGITVIVTASLGLAVGAVITSQTLFATTQEHLANYATLLAVGFSRHLLSQVVLLQSLLVGIGGITLGSLLFFPAAWASARTPIPLEQTPLIFSSLMGVFLLTCLLASMLSLRTVFKLDPVVVFSQ